MRLYLVRHPQPLVAQGVCYGVSNVVCSREALESAADHLLQVLPKGLAVISSPLSRCAQLALHLCRREASFAYKTDEKLVEMDFGAWEMQAWDAIPKDELSAWTDAFASYRCGSTGESTGQFVRRVALRLRESKQGGEDQIWITHAGVIRAVQWLSNQPLKLLTELLIEQPDPALLLSHFRAADWPTGEVAFGQVYRARPWDWPPEWPQVVH